MIGLALLALAATEPPVVPPPAPPTVRSGGAAARALTVYRDDLGFITERHVVDLPEGAARIVLGGVSDRMVPETARVTGLDGTVLTRDFTANLLTKQTLFDSLVGETALLQRTNPETGTAETVPVRILSAARSVVMETPDGIEALDCQGLAQALAAPERPDDLSARPELSVDVESAAAGTAILTVSYLVRDLAWAADYVVTVAGETASVRGWLTINNDTNTSFEDSPAAIIAGTLNIDRETQPPYTYARGYGAFCWPEGSTAGPFPVRNASNPYLLGFRPEDQRRARVAMAAAAPEAVMADEIVVTGSRVRTAEEERFGDYRLYRPPGPVTLNPYQTKQIAFLDAQGVAFEKRYAVDVAPWADEDDLIPAAVIYDLDNTADGALARALPAGTARVSTVVGDELLYLGEDETEDRAVGLPVEIEAGQTTALRAYAEAEDREDADDARLWPRGATQRLVTVVQNGTPDAAEVTIRLDDWADEYGFVEIVSLSGGARGEEANTVTMTVPGGEEARAVLFLRTPD